MNAFDVVRMFEAALCEYTGARYAVATTSCTMALLLALLQCKGCSGRVVIPRRTYVGVAHSVVNAGLELGFKDEFWKGRYQLEPTPVWDYARRFRRGMYVPGQMQCVSFHWTKILSIGQGGAILHDNEDADAWLRRARFDGRDHMGPTSQISLHAYMMPRDAAEGLARLQYLPADNDDLPNSDYPDLSTLDWTR